MIYTDKTVKAMKLAFDAHKEQVDKIGVPYVYHIMDVASQMNTEDTTIVALLHDVVEDTDVTLDDLSKMFDAHIVSAIDSITRRKDEEYFQYICRVKQNTLATTVKIQDLIHNTNLYRVQIADMSVSLFMRYKKALKILIQ